MPSHSTTAEFTQAEREVARRRPIDLKASNGNDVRSFVHAWFAAFDHAAAAEFFLGHLDDGDMTFNMDDQSLAHDHATFREWYADALVHIPWDYHDVRDIAVAGLDTTGWTAEFLFRHVGEWRDERDGPVRPFNRVLRATWRLEHDGERFLIRRYELTTVQTSLAI